VTKLKPKFSGKDFFTKKSFNPLENRVVETNWKTIFNSEIACLKAVQAILE